MIAALLFMFAAAFTPPREIDVRVVTADLAPLQGTYVAVAPVGKKPTRNHQTFTDATGRVRFRDLDPRSYDVTVQSPGGFASVKACAADAITALQQWQFKPGKLNTQPVDTIQRFVVTNCRITLAR